MKNPYNIIIAEKLQETGYGCYKQERMCDVCDK